MDSDRTRIVLIRAKADEARRNAEAAGDPTTRQDWLDIATGYDLLVEAAEAQAKPRPGRS